jgi:N-acetyltransferase
MVYGDIRDESGIRDWVQEMLERQSRGTDLPFAVVLQSSGLAIGATRFMSIQQEHKTLEIGGTWYGLAYQGKAVNTDAKYLLLSYAFEHLKVHRVQLKTDSRNLRSQKAIEKLGAKREGVLRRHMVLKDGTLRDSVVYSIIDLEWPDVKLRLRERLENQIAGGEVG